MIYRQVESGQAQASEVSTLIAEIISSHRVTQLKYLRISFAAQFLLAAYFQTVNWFPLGKWNYQPDFVPLINAPRVELGDVAIDCLFLLPFLLFVLAYWRDWKWLMWIGVFGYGIWLFLQIQTWWIPYLFGASDRWQEVYHRVFAQSTKLLPSFGNHLAPDAMHLTIQFLLIVILTSLIPGLLQKERK